MAIIGIGLRVLGQFAFTAIRSGAQLAASGTRSAYLRGQAGGGGGRAGPVQVSYRVHGLRELIRDLNRAQADIGKELREALKEAGEPVRDEATMLASRWGGNWSRMRVGFARGGVYVAPAARRQGFSPRPNFGGMLLRDALEPALERKQDEAVRRIEQAIDDVLKRHNL